MRNIRRQSGFSLLEVMLAVTVAIALGSLHLSQIRQEVEDTQARTVGEQLQTVGEAFNTYLAMQYGPITAGTDIVDAGTADDPGPRTCTASASGHLCQVTSDTLRRRGLLPQSFSGQNAYGSQYEYWIRVAGTAPNWQVSGIVRTVDPYVVGGVVRYDLIGSAMYVAGADSGAVRTSVEVINGLNGTWTEDPADPMNPLPFPVGQLGQMAYRVGYGTSGYAAYVRLDGTIPMEGDLNMAGYNIVNAHDILADGEVSASRLATNLPRNDAIILGAENITDRTTLGNAGNRLEVRNIGGMQLVDDHGDGTPLLAGDINIGNLNSSGTGVFAGAIQANGISTTGGANIHSSGQITAVGNFETTAGNFSTTDGSFITTNGDISAVGGTISAGNLVVTGSATIGNSLTFNSNGAGWFYQPGVDTMLLGNNSNLRVSGDIRADGNITSEGMVEAGTFLRLTNPSGIGSACTGNIFSVAPNGRLLQCVSGNFREAGGINNVVTVNAGSAAGAGGTSTAVCGSGHKMVSGGYILEQRLAYNDPTAPTQSYGNPAGNAWVVYNAPDGNSSTFRAHAVCVN